MNKKFRISPEVTLPPRGKYFFNMENNYPEGLCLCITRLTLKTILKNCSAGEIVSALQQLCEGGDGSTLNRREKVIFESILADNSEFEVE